MHQAHNFPDSWDGLEELYGFKFINCDGKDIDDLRLMVRNAPACFMNMTEAVMKEWAVFIEDPTPHHVAGG